MTLALDFGTTNTVIARWNETLQETDIPDLAGLTRTCPLPGGSATSVIPSLIHIAPGGERLIGAQVEDAGLSSHPATFRWLKMDLLRSGGANRSRRVSGELLYPRTAATDLVDRILLFLNGHYGGIDEELVLTVPVEAYDHYLDWLENTARKRFSGSIRLIDEATACILGYEGRIEENSACCIIDFGGGTLDISIVRTTQETRDRGTCRVLGRAGEEIGGMMIDNWLLQHIRRKESLSDADIADIGTSLLTAAEEAKIALSNGSEKADITAYNDLTGKLTSTTVTASELCDILEQEREPGNYSLYQLLTRTLDRALEAARTGTGTTKEELSAVFLVGGSSMLPGVTQRVRDYFPDCRIHSNRPFDAVARGACRYNATAIDQTLTHDYCLQSWNRSKKQFELVPVVPRGTAYPTSGPVSSKYIKAACQDQQVLGMVIYERSVMQRPGISFVHGADGLYPADRATGQEERDKPLNPEDHDFIHAVPPCTPGTRRFIAGFGVDEQRRLTLWLQDTLEGNRSYIRLRDSRILPLPVSDVPVVRL
ncbi:Hsp70 family protein [Prosthecochloris sp. N3]|uniref:Hsp70 family protein n=1 Tax=Prosthecochloris ethylica TaxID=2743976 RepID=A0ABR9XTP8_9CHLB|nr:Hsp70 family protein [Prosthecochloris ethylica]MBF0587064.1 Hsp70 family protein [Prosthecochloris ethylica]MBF0637238.1 Hsp70 family protein [Prosthecochloris ethylica]MEC9486896.1 Hsp70 family protein [Prosthecochloris sp.]NUK48217.1 Hsp70 family protein [Prosthecochloris ethylica]